MTGQDKPTCRNFFLKRVRACQIEFCDPDDPSWTAGEAFECFHNFTGGNVRLLRAILLCLSERRFRFGEGSENHAGYKRRVVEKSFFDYAEVPLFGVKLFHGAKLLIQQDREVLIRLEELLDQIQAARDRGIDLENACISASVPTLEEAPEPLELAGFLRRDAETKCLRFSSLYIAEFAVRYFSWARRGDFHARQGDWEKAFECYDKVERPEQRRRPMGEHDFRIMRTIVNRLCREFAECITNEKATDRLRVLLDKTGRLLFGLRVARVLQVNDKGAWSFDGCASQLFLSSIGR